ncbi:MAG: hypothetical protein R3B09_28700 [Nannocystaceae bacterium]
MPALSFAPTLRAAVKGADAVVVVAPQSVLTGSGCPSILDTPVQELLVELARLVKPGDIGAVGSTLTGTAPRRLYAAVLPDRVSRGNTPTRAESIRRVIPAGDLGQYKRAALILVLDDASHYVAAANAIARAFPDFSMKSGPGSDLAVAIVAIDRQGNFIKASPRVGETMNTTRAVSALVDTPPTDLNPEAYAREARRILGGLKGVKIKEIVGDALLKNKLGGIHAVGRTALSAPRMLVATYTPAKAKRHIALVGKGVTYDTGGLNLKVGGVMSNMKCDMAGSAALLGAFRVLVAGGCKPRQALADPLHGRERDRPQLLQARRHPDPPLGEDGRDQQHRRRGAPPPRRRGLLRRPGAQGRHRDRRGDPHRRPDDRHRPPPPR